MRAFCFNARPADGVRRKRLVDGDELLKTIHLNQLIDVFVWIGIGSRVLVLHLSYQQRQEIIRRDGCRITFCAVARRGCLAFDGLRTGRLVRS